jgi:uncharacterized membrane protein YjjP (DUF1212 family)
MTIEEQSDLILGFARILFVNGQSTDQTLAAVRRLGNAVGLRTETLVHWGGVQLYAENKDARFISLIQANPTAVNMARVVCTMRAVEDLCKGRLAPSSAVRTLSAIAQVPPASNWLFTLAAAAGAVALAGIFGIQHLPAAAIIFVSAGAGAILRRSMARYSENVFLQPFCASLLAGIIGALAVRYRLSSTLRLVAVCPCMVLVPGPHVLNGALDLIRGRVGLGAARLIYAGLVIMAISMGLLVGLASLGVSFPIDPAGRAIPLWLDTVAAGVAVFAYSIFFSTPLRMVAWPIAVGMLAHAMRWWSLAALDCTPATGALIACLIVGSILAPIAHRRYMPFAAIGFASVVSMIPGVFLFRMASGLIQLAGESHATRELISATVTDGMTAVTIFLAMSFGLLVPKLAIDHLTKGTLHTTF